MYIVYILKSIKFDRYYIGHTADLNQRLKDHNRGKVRSTKAFVPWEIVYQEKFATKSEAYKREMQIKSYKSGEAFRNLLNKQNFSLERWVSGCRRLRRGPAESGKTIFVLMYIVYILKSIKFDRYYIGHTADLNQRLKDHNRGKVRSTKAYVPWELVYREEYSSKSEAYKRELQIKSYKSGDAFRNLLNK